MEINAALIVQRGREGRWVIGTEENRPTWELSIEPGEPAVYEVTPGGTLEIYPSLAHFVLLAEDAIG